MLELRPYLRRSDREREHKRWNSLLRKDASLRSSTSEVAGGYCINLQQFVGNPYIILDLSYAPFTWLLVFMTTRTSLVDLIQ